MRERNRQQGSITVFAIIVIGLVVGFLLTLLEGARANELRRIARLRTDMSVESAFANYNQVLWETYRLLGNNLVQAEQIIEDSAGSGYTEYEYGVNFLLLKLQSTEVEGYTLLTDGDGSAYIQTVSSYMQNNILYETAKALYNQFESIRNLVNSGDITGTEIEDALESLEALENSKISEKEGKLINQVTAAADSGERVRSVGTSGENVTENSSNVLEEVRHMQQTQLLELVIPDTTELSDSEFDLSNSVSQRELEKGKNSVTEETDWLDRVLLQQYLLTYFADYSNPAKDRGLSYELEYLIAGTDNDIENLRTVVNELLMIREAANFVYLLSDGDKMLQAELLATVLGGASANPAIIQVVKIGLLLAWAFAESVLDVRALLQGKKIPLVKSQDLWTLALENIGSLSKEYLVAKESDLGISYKTYLGILLLFQSDRSLAYRAMDMQEITLQKTDDSLQMDQMIVRMRVTNTYTCAPVFASLKSINGKSGWNYKLEATSEYGYN